MSLRLVLPNIARGQKTTLPAGKKPGYGKDEILSTDCIWIICYLSTAVRAVSETGDNRCVREAKEELLLCAAGKIEHPHGTGTQKGSNA